MPTAPTKRCSTCQEVKPVDTFSGDASKRDGKRVNCKPCEKSLFRLRTYGVTPETFTEMWCDQGGLCAVCPAELHMGRRGHTVDHNHDTGEVRGLLCSTCNSALGLFKDNPATLLAAHKYLTERGHYGVTP